MKCSELKFQEGNWVFVKLQPYHQHSMLLHQNHKLGMKYFGFFQVLQKVGDVANRLNLTTGSKIHQVFHVSLLKQCLGDPSMMTLSLPLISCSQGPIIFPTVILHNCKIRKEKQLVSRVLIQQHGLAAEETSWEDVDQLIRQYP